MPMTKNRIEISKGGKGKTIYIPLSVYRAGKHSLTISCSDPNHAFKYGTTPEQLEKFRNKLHDIFSDLVGPKPTILTLHEAIKVVLEEAGRPMSTREIASELNRRNLYRRKDGGGITAFQVHGRTKNYPKLFRRDGANVCLI